MHSNPQQMQIDTDGDSRDRNSHSKRARVGKIHRGRYDDDDDEEEDNDHDGAHKQERHPQSQEELRNSHDRGMSTLFTLTAYKRIDSISL